MEKSNSERKTPSNHVGSPQIPPSMYHAENEDTDFPGSRCAMCRFDCLVAQNRYMDYCNLHDGCHCGSEVDFNYRRD